MTKVLIVEDEDLVARMYEKALSFDGFEVKVTLGGRDGLLKVREFKPDIILLDIMMPEPDGIEVLEKLKADDETRNIPVVMLTNLSGKYDAELAIDKGARDFWIKSEIKMRDLGNKINEVLNEQYPKQES